MSHMGKMDNSTFVKYLTQFPEQISKILESFSAKKVKVDQSIINNVICIGMGGSAIAGDVIKDSLFERINLPITVVRGYESPNFCNEKSLVIACSYSGNTEETLSAIKKAKEKKAQIAVITSGGELAELAKENKWTELKIPGKLPPRQAFGYLFFSILMLLSHLKIVDVDEQEIKSIIKLSKKMVRWNQDESTSDRILSKELARKIRNKIPIVYAPTPQYSSVAMRWKTQFQENSKSMAFFNTIPEMNHNEIVGWEMESAVLENFIVIFLQCDDMPERIATRIELTKNIIKAKNISIAEIYAEGKTKLEKAISFILLGDWTSYYLAKFYNKDPESILNIDYLKSELKKIQ
jgi:glucose/mannose-6-phosphate isomerase